MIFITLVSVHESSPREWPVRCHEQWHWISVSVWPDVKHLTLIISDMMWDAQQITCTCVHLLFHLVWTCHMVVGTSESPFVVSFPSLHREFNVQIHVLLLRFHAIFSHSLENDDARLGRTDNIDSFIIRQSSLSYSSQEVDSLLKC